MRNNKASLPGLINYLALSKYPSLEGGRFTQEVSGVAGHLCARPHPREGYTCNWHVKAKSVYIFISFIQGF